MSKVTIRPAARADLKRIGRHTEGEWGREQRTRYLRQLEELIGLLVDNPKMGMRRDDLREGYRSLHAGRHMVFYRETATGIEIVRVLHASMDAERHL
jgi:toxin ParE1/3/4